MDFFEPSCLFGESLLQAVLRCLSGPRGLWLRRDGRGELHLSCPALSSLVACSRHAHQFFTQSSVAWLLERVGASFDIGDEKFCLISSADQCDAAELIGRIAGRGIDWLVDGLLARMDASSGAPSTSRPTMISKIFSDLEVKMSVLMALARLATRGDHRVVDHFLRFLSSTHADSESFVDLRNHNHNCRRLLNALPDIAAPNDDEVARQLFPLVTLPDVRAEALDSILKIAGSSPEVLGRLCQMTQSPDKDLVHKVLFALRTRAKGAVCAREAVLAAMEDPDTNVRMTAVRVLPDVVDSATEKEVAAACRLLTDANHGNYGSVSCAAGHALLKLAAPGNPVVMEALVPCLTSSSPDVVRTALNVVSKLGVQNQRLCRAVALRLQSPGSDELEPDGPDVNTGFQYPPKAVSLEAIGSVSERGDAEILELIRPFLNDQDVNIRSAAIEALGQVCSFEDTEALSQIREFVKDSSETVSAAAIMGLGYATPQADLAEVLKPYLFAEDSSTRFYATNAVAYLTASGDVASCNVLHAKLEDSYWLVRRTALQGLFKGFRV